MEPKAFKILLRRAVLLPLLTMATLATVLLFEAYDLHRSMQRVDHTDQVTSSSRRLLKLTVDMETGLRGFLVTGNPVFLQPYEEARQNLEPHYQSLYRLVGDDPNQQARLAAWHESYLQWRRYAERMIELRRTGGAYNDIAANLEGKRRMDAIREEVRDFQDIEDQLRDTGTRTARFRWRLIVASCIVVGIGAGLVIGFLTFVEMRDLAASFQRSLDTAKSRAAELARSEERWATTLASIGDAVMATDAEGKITFVNAIAESLLEMSARDCMGRSSDEVFRLEQEESGAAVESPVTKAIRLDRVIELGNSVVLLGNQGAHTPIADSAAPIRDASGLMTGVVLVFRDVTERRNRERERSEALAREQVQRQIAEETATRLRKIEEVTEATLAHLPLETMMELLLRRVVAALQADSAQILLLDRQNQTLEVRTSLGLQGTVARVPMGTGIAGTIAQTGQLKIVEDLTQADVLDPEVREQAASLMGVPLLVEDRVIGVLHVDSRIQRTFTQEEASLLQRVGDRIAPAIEGRQAEEALRKSKQLLEDFIREAPVALAMFDRNMHFLQFSRRWVQDTGWQGGNLLGKTHCEAFPHMPEHWKDMHRRGLAGESLSAEEDWIAADGKTHTIRWEIHPWGDEGTESGGIIVSFADLTERKQMENALRESEGVLRTVTDHALVGLVMLDKDRRYVFANKAYSDALRMPDADIIGKRVPEVMGKLYDQIRPRLDRAYAGERVSYELTMPERDGEADRFYTVSYEPRRESGEVAGMIVMVVDITERKRAEESVRASEERWATTLQSIGDAVISTDAAGRIMFMNEMAQKLTGWTLEEVQGADLSGVFNIVQEGTRLRPENPVSKVLRLGKVVGLANHTLLIRRDGTEIPIEDSGAPIRDRQNRIEGVVLVFHDVSEQRQIQKTIRESDRLATTGRLAATIAHEIHNPLDAVGNLLYLIQQGSRETETRNFAALAAEELQRVTQMTQQMLTFQRESAKPTKVKIREVLDNIFALFERQIHAAGARVSAEIDYEGEVRALPGELRQVLANLIGNGLEALQDGQGRLRVRAYASKDRRRGGSGLRVVVADNGCGIPDEIREKIFDPFFTTKGESGTGLGLWIASGIIEKYGGAIRVRSTTREGRSGTCFSLFFPSEVNEA